MMTAPENGDAVGFALVADVDVDLCGADVDVAGELADHLERDAALGEHRAERVAQRVSSPSVLDGCRPPQRACQRSPPPLPATAAPGGALALAQADEQRVRTGRRPGGVPPPQGIVRLGVQRHGPRAAALGAADDDLELGLVAAAGRDRGAPAGVGLAAALLDVA